MISVQPKNIEISRIARRLCMSMNKCVAPLGLIVKRINKEEINAY